MPLLHSPLSQRAKADTTMTTSLPQTPVIDRKALIDSLVSDCRHLIATGTSLKGMRFVVIPYDCNHEIGFTVKALPPMSHTLLRLVTSFRSQAMPALEPALKVTALPTGTVSLRCYGEDVLGLTKTVSLEDAARDPKEIVAGNVCDWIMHYSASDPDQSPVFGLCHAHLS